MDIDSKYFKERPNFDEYFFDIARAVSKRSEDVFIQHGAVIVDENNHIVGTGYNGFVKGFDFLKMEVNPYDRNQRRPYMIHAEQNAILNSVTRPSHSTIYITGEPCVQCLLSMVNFGVKNIIYIDGVGSITDNDSTREIKRKIVKGSGVNFMSAT